MSVTITALSTGQTTVANFQDGYALAASARTITHDFIGGGIGFTLLPARPLSGTLRLVYGYREADARAAVALLSLATLFALADTERPAGDGTFAVVGSGARLVLDDDTRTAWLVEVEVQQA